MLPSSFSRQCDLYGFATYFRSPSRLGVGTRTSLRTRLNAWTGLTITLLRLACCVPASVNRTLVVQEFQPVVHRLRHFVLGLGPDLP